jgi:hypothetical protein
LLSRSATVEIEGGDAVFGEGVHRQMRFRQKEQRRNAAGRGKLMPLTFTDDEKAEFLDYLAAKSAQNRRIGEFIALAADCIDKPFGSDIHVILAFSLKMSGTFYRFFTVQEEIIVTDIASRVKP